MNTMRQPLVVIFDGECGFCRKSIDFIARQDRRRELRFEASQSTRGRELLEKLNLLEAAKVTVIGIDGDDILLRSDAFIAIAARLGGGWRALTLVRFLPRRIRDGAYDFVARHQAQILRGSTCGVPSEALRSRRVERVGRP